MVSQAAFTHNIVPRRSVNITALARASNATSFSRGSASDSVPASTVLCSTVSPTIAPPRVHANRASHAAQRRVNRCRRLPQADFRPSGAKRPAMIAPQARQRLPSSA